jgi:hypothetical protein
VAQSEKSRKTDLGGDELESSELAPCLLLDDVLHLWIDLCERRIEHLVLDVIVSQYNGRSISGTFRTKSGVLAVAIALREKRKAGEVMEERERGLARSRNIGSGRDLVVCKKKSDGPADTR